jgi:hypothetical protein
MGMMIVPYSIFGKRGVVLHFYGRTASCTSRHVRTQLKVSGKNPASSHCGTAWKFKPVATLHYDFRQGNTIGQSRLSRLFQKI